MGATVRVADNFIERMVARAEGLRIGDGMSDETEVGPLVDAKQFRNVLRYIDVGKEDGAYVISAPQHAAPAVELRDCVSVIARRSDVATLRLGDVTSHR